MTVRGATPADPAKRSTPDRSVAVSILSGLGAIDPPVGFVLSILERARNSSPFVGRKCAVEFNMRQATRGCS
jgi:hypothetical protein